MSEVRRVETGPKARRGKLALGAAFVSALVALTPAKAEGQNLERACAAHENSALREDSENIARGGFGMVEAWADPGTNSIQTINGLNDDYLTVLKTRFESCARQSSRDSAYFSPLIRMIQAELDARREFRAALQRGVGHAEARNIYYQTFTDRGIDMAELERVHDRVYENLGNDFTYDFQTVAEAQRGVRIANSELGRIRDTRTIAMGPSF